MEDALLARLFVPGGLREELTRARNFYMLTTGSARHMLHQGAVKAATLAAGLQSSCRTW